MPYHRYMSTLHLDQAELDSRLAFFEITREDLARLASLRGFAEKYTDEIVRELYTLILGHPESKALFTDKGMVAHVQEQQRGYFRGLFRGVVDLPYMEDRLRVGVAHERAGIPPKFYIGAYSRYRRLIDERLRGELPPAEAAAAAESVDKMIAFDMALAMDTYIAAGNEALLRHEAALRELSTPVIRVYDRVLLLPLIGAIDTLRAEQIMERVLLRVVEERAKAIIIDIAGVPVVDTRVADHLLKTTEAVRLLGGTTILTGITPTVAKTIVRLGLDISAMRTTSLLSEGLELALSITGKQVGQRGATMEPHAVDAARGGGTHGGTT